MVSKKNEKKQQKKDQKLKIKPILAPSYRDLQKNRPPYKKVYK